MVFARVRSQGSGLDRLVGWVFQDALGNGRRMRNIFLGRPMTTLQVKTHVSSSTEVISYFSSGSTTGSCPHGGFATRAQPRRL
jgi:hypothetical protein